MFIGNGISISRPCGSASQGGIDSYTKLLLHFDNDVTDSSLNAYTVTNTGSITFTNTAGLYKFGYAGSFNGTSKYAIVADNTDWTFGTNDFTIDLWMTIATAGGQKDIIGQYVDGNNAWALYQNADKILFYSIVGGVGTGYYAMTNAYGFANNTEYHIQFSRNGAGALLFVNGVSQALTTITAFGNLSDLASPLRIGNVFSGTAFFNGTMDELRISKGICRNTVDFTPPALPYSQ